VTRAPCRSAHRSSRLIRTFFLERPWTSRTDFGKISRARDAPHAPRGRRSPSVRRVCDASRAASTCVVAAIPPHFHVHRRATEGQRRRRQRPRAVVASPFATLQEIGRRWRDTIIPVARARWPCCRARGATFVCPLAEALHRRRVMSDRRSDDDAHAPGLEKRRVSSAPCRRRSA